MTGSTGESHDKATLHLGPTADESEQLAEVIELPSEQEQIDAHAQAYVHPDRSDWVTCLPECHWADDGSGRDTGRMTPLAIHAEGCPHSNSKYVEFVAAPTR